MIKMLNEERKKIKNLLKGKFDNDQQRRNRVAYSSMSGGSSVMSGKSTLMSGSSPICNSSIHSRELKLNVKSES